MISLARGKLVLYERPRNSTRDPQGSVAGNRVTKSVE